MASIIKDRFKFRRKTSAEWATLNEVLLEGEIGVVLGTNPVNFKIGDGVTAWNGLEFLNGDIQLEVDAIEQDILAINQDIATHESELTELEANKVDKETGKGLSTDDFKEIEYTKIKPSKNKFSKSQIIEGYAVNNTTGDIVTITNWSIARIPVKASTVYVFTSSLPVSDLRVRFESTNNSLISFLNATVKPFTFITPANCSYIVLPSRVGGSVSIYDTLQVEEGTTPSSYTIYAEQINESDLYLPSFIKKTYAGKNKFDRSRILENYAINSGTGAIVPLANWSVNRIEVKPSTTYTYSTELGLQDIRVRFEDVNKSLISFSNAASKPFTFTTPSNCTSVVLPARVNNGSVNIYNTSQLEEGSTPTTYEDFYTIIDPKYLTLSRWYNKKIVFFGDSITEMNRYQKIVQFRLGNIYSNDAVSGSCVATGKEDIEPDNIHRSALVTRAAGIDLLAPDLIVIFAGTNDWYYNVPVGVITDSVTTTYYGAYKTLIQTIQSQNPKARVCAINMLQRTNSRANYSSQKGYADATIEVCKMYGVPCYNAFSKSGITYENISNWTSDNVHPSRPDGDTLIGEQFSSFINSL